MGAIGLPLQNTGTDVAVDIKATHSNQTLLRLRDTSGSTLFSVHNDGTVTVADTTRFPQYTEVTLTAAQILDLADTPVELVPAQGAGTVIEFLGAVLFLDHAGTGFAETADNLQIAYINEAGTKASQVIEMTGFIDQTADTMTTAEPKIDTIGAKAAVENAALVIANINDEFTDAGTTTSVLRIKTRYVVHTTGW